MHKPVKIDLDQKSQSWLDWRLNGIGASESAIVMMGEDYPYSTNLQKLWAVKTGVLEPEVVDNKFTQRGNELEPVARDLFTRRTGIEVAPECFEHPTYSFIKASMDGISEDGKIICEIKCPSSKDRHQTALEGRIPEEYYCQMQHQFLVTGAKIGYFVSYFPEFESDNVVTEFVMIKIKPNHSYMESLLRKLIKFWKYVEDRNLPTENALDTDISTNSKMSGLFQISGYAQSGKDTFGKALTRVFKSTRYAFADELKKVYMQMMGITEDELNADKEAHRPALVALGAGIRSVYSETWLKGVFKRKTGIYEKMKTYGAHITDVRYINEVSHGIIKSSELQVPCRTVWIDSTARGIQPANEEERQTTAYIEDIADIVIKNDVELDDPELLDKVFDYVVLRIYNGNRSISVSEVLESKFRSYGRQKVNKNASKKIKSSSK